MNDSNNTPKGLRGWWGSPPRSGWRIIIAPWEYRHARAFARVRITAGAVLAGLGLITFAAGGSDWEAAGWAMVFLAGAAGHLLYAAWLLRIARSAPVPA